MVTMSRGNCKVRRSQMHSCQPLKIRFRDKLCLYTYVRAVAKMAQQLYAGLVLLIVLEIEMAMTGV